MRAAPSSNQVRDLTGVQSRDVTYATLCQGSFEKSVRYRDFMGWTMPWYSAEASLPVLLAGRKPGMMYDEQDDGKFSPEVRARAVRVVLDTRRITRRGG